MRWPVNFTFRQRGSKALAAVLCEPYLRRAPDSLEGVLCRMQENTGLPEALGRPGLETQQGCQEPSPDFHDSPGDGAACSGWLQRAALPLWVEVTGGRMGLRVEQAWWLA